MKRLAIGDRRFAGLRTCRLADLLPLTCYLLFAILLLWRPLFAGEAFYWGTPLLQFVPWLRLAAGMWRTGHVPLWNPLVGCGAPLAANYQTGALYPLNVLHLLVPTEVALSWTVALHLALAGLGMYAWGRAIGLDCFPALIAGLALEGSGFLVARAALFPSIALTFPWTPVWLWRGELLVRRRRLHDVLWLGLALGMGLLAGHAQTAFYGGLLLTAYLAFRLLQTRCRPANWQTCSLLIASFLIGIGLAAIQLLPTAELLLQSQRAEGVGYDAGLTYSFWPWRLITFIAPDFFGNPGRGDYWGYATYWEDTGYVGVLPLLLAIGTVVRKGGGAGGQGGKGAGGQTWFWMLCGAAALVLALGKNTPLFPFLFRHVPAFNLFQSPARWLAVTTVALAALAGIGAQHWPAGRAAWRLGALWLVVGAALLIGGAAAPRLIAGERLATFGVATARLGVLLVVAGGLVLMQRDNHWWQTAILAFVTLDLLLSGWPLVPTVDRALYQGNAHALLRRQSDVRIYWPADPANPGSDLDAEYRIKFRYLTFRSFGPRDAAYWRGMREALVPNAGMLDGIAAANNFDPLLVGHYAEMMAAVPTSPSLLRVMGVTHVAVESPVSFDRLPDALGRAWVVPAARRVPIEEALNALDDPTFDPAAEALIEATPLPASSSPASYSLTLRDTPNGITIHAVLDAPGYLVLADTWYPGWQATVDGGPAKILRANYAFRAVYLEAGEHTVEMIYRPRSFIIGASISGATLIAWVACRLIRWLRERREQT